MSRMGSTFKVDIYFVSLFGNNFFYIDNTFEECLKPIKFYSGFSCSVFIYKLFIKKDYVINPVYYEGDLQTNPDKQCF